MLDFESRIRNSTTIQELHVLDNMGGRGWVGLVCFESSGEDHVSFHIIFIAFSLNLHLFTCHVENTSFHFFFKKHTCSLMNIIYVCIYIRIYIYICTYVRIVGGFGGPLLDTFWADFGAKKLGQKNSDQTILHV